MSSEANATQLSMESELTIIHAAELRNTLLAQLRDSEALEIDMGRVEELDAAGLQLLISLKREADETDKHLRLTHMGARLTKALQLMGVADLLGESASAGGKV